MCRTVYSYFNHNGKMTETRNLKLLPSDSQLIAISGKQYAGKDLLTSLLLKHLPDFQKVPLAGAIKQAYAKQHQISLEVLEANKAMHRPGLIALGNWGREQDPDYWLKQVLIQPGKKIISDLRLKREYDLLKAEGAYLIRLEASREVRAERGTIVSEADPTETDLDSITEWDAVLENNADIAQLQHQINDLIYT